MPNIVSQDDLQWDSTSTMHMPEAEALKYCSQYKTQDMFSSRYFSTKNTLLHASMIYCPFLFPFGGILQNTQLLFTLYEVRTHIKPSPSWYRYLQKTKKSLRILNYSLPRCKVWNGKEYSFTFCLWNKKSKSISCLLNNTSQRLRSNLMSRNQRLNSTLHLLRGSLQARCVIEVIYHVFAHSSYILPR